MVRWYASSIMQYLLLVLLNEEALSREAWRFRFF